ncbi:type 1 glutamine amidotransferase [Candidatus Uabimicrobium sp. HlEnr_7]|uniref:type 1 glutamine amidotransferase n=1 Tax=Candidatus Uabimicrobium helgolandensis TaxID=3095367 RepID=UPI003556C217
MDIAILKAEITHEPVREKVCDVTDLYKTFFSGHTTTFFDVCQGVYPQKKHDLYVLTGSAASAYDNTPWVKTLQKFVVDNSKERFLGICFGHQLIAEALGGKVAKVLWNLGAREVTIQQHEKWMVTKPEKLYAIFNHKDQVVTLPNNAKLLAGNDIVPIQMYCIEKRILCMQCHPEYIPSYQKVLMNHIKNVIGDVTVIEEAMRSYQENKSIFSMKLWIERFFNMQ